MGSVNRGSSVDLEAQDGSPQSDGSEGDADGDSGGGAAGPGSSVPAPGGDGLGGNPRLIRDTLDGCAAEPCGTDGGAARAVTLSDLAAFTPATPSIRMEPAGWIVRGLPANFIAGATVNDRQGTLLGRPVEVRFSPVDYTWDWGDGSTHTFATAGRTWEQLGLRRFAETPTSHVFSERGSVTVALQVDYAVAYRFADGPWITVDGTVTATSAIDATVVSAKTVLVDGDCASDPGGPGC